MHSSAMLRRLTLVATAVTALALPVAAATSASASTTPRTWRVTVGSQTPDMAIQTMVFLPKEVWVDAGDTVHWVAGAAEPHTVTFLAPGATLPEFNPFDPTQVGPVGGTTEDGTAYTNSGVMGLQTIALLGTPRTTYDLTFPTKGTYTYYCLLHGVMMTGTVHVQAAGTRYPFSQADYNRQAAAQSLTAITEGRNLWRQTRLDTAPGTVTMGAVGTQAMVMRFIFHRTVVHVGDSVTFMEGANTAPHTVTFGTEPAGLGILNPSGDATHYVGGDLNSGLLAAPGSTFKVTFDKAGTYHYICALHDDMGMMGDIIVRR
jgi:plastocyanin